MRKNLVPFVFCHSNFIAIVGLRMQSLFYLYMVYSFALTSCSLVIIRSKIRSFVLAISCLFCCATAIAQHRDTFNIYFEKGRHELTDEATAEIDRIILSQKKIHYQQVTILGYADQTGNKAANNALSVRRAANAKDYLKKKGFTAPIQICTGRGAISRQQQNKEGFASDRKVQIITEYTRPSEISAKPLPKQIFIKPLPKRTVTLTQQLDTLTLNETIVLKNIHFKYSSPILMPESEPYLMELYNYLAHRKSIRIKIEGHICCTGQYIVEDDGTGLSAQRARTINDFLVNHGIAQDRLQYEGMGSANPITEKELTEADRELNRRVEIRVLSR